MAARTLVAAAVAVAAGLGACANPPASPAQRELEERRLLAPFRAEREVGCGELFVELTPNFDGNVGRPAVDRARHTVVRERGDGFVDTVWTNPAGSPDAAFVVAIGDAPSLGEAGWVEGQKTRFRVVNQVRIRVHEAPRALTLAATAEGPVVVVKDASGPPRDAERFAIADGALRR